jgi:hypothetical protein
MQAVQRDRPSASVIMPAGQSTIVLPATSTIPLVGRGRA